MSKQLGVRVSEELFDAVERARGDVPRTRFVVRALEAALVGLDRPPVAPDVTSEAPDTRRKPASANFGSLGIQRYGPRQPRGKPFQKS